jgi:hypothetical protein
MLCAAPFATLFSSRKPGVPALYVPNTHPTRSCNELVLVNEAAEDLMSTQLCRIGPVDCGMSNALRLFEGTVAPLAIAREGRSVPADPPATTRSLI